MTEQNTSYGATAVATPPAPPLAPEYDDTTDGGSRNKLLAVGAAAGVLVLLIVAFFLMKGGGSGTDPEFGVAPPAPPQSAGKDAGKPAADKPVTLPKTYKNAVGRDPFKALYVEPVKAPTETTDGSTGTDTTVPPAVSVPPTTSTDGTSTDTTAPPSASYAPVWVALESVQGTKSATFLVGYSNGKKAKQVRFSDVVAPTRTLQTQFASVFALLSIQDGTVTVQFGDATPFDLAPGFGNRHFVG
jgi:hypothetical protein